MATVTWRNVVAVLVATVLGLGALVVVFRSDGIPGIDALASRATRWFVHQPTGRVVLADGYGGRALASLDADAQGAEIRVVEGGPGAYVINDTSGEVRSIDTAELRLGPAQGLVTLGSGRSAAGVGSSGLVVVDRAENNASLLPVGGEAVGFDVDVGDTAVIAPDGVIWSMVDGALMRNTAAGSTTVISGIGASAALSLVGNQPLLLDRENRRARLGDGNWNPLSTSASPSEIIVQQPGPANGCGWVGSGDELWCVSAGGIDESVVIAGLDIGGSDFLAIAGDAAALVRRGPTEIVRFDWRTGIVLPGLRASINGGAVPDVIATVDLVWVDDVAGDFVWAINPWAISAINKNDGATLVLGEDGRIIDDGGGAGGAGVGAGDGGGSEPEERLPDNNGIDDPPVAVDDPVRARTGRTVPVPVTANDYDPDGEAIAVVAVGRAGHGSVEIGTASTVVYTPEPGYVGLDEFTYTIADGDGTEASAQVTIDLIALDATNQPPVGTPDEAETGPGVPVVIDVLLNDVDPDRDPIQIGSFTVPDGVGAVTETVGPSGLAGLRFQPLDGFEGSAVFAYRPVDSFGALGDDVDVRVQVAREGDDNRPPVVRPDSVRLRRGVITLLPVLVNDEDPDGDRLELSVVSPLPEGLRVDVRGEQLAITARAGSAESIPFEYAVDDGNGHVVKGAVLVDVIDDFEPNRPPVAVADADAAVVGRTIQIDVLANDTDPDGDPLVVVDVSQPADGRGQAVVLAPDRIQFTPAALDDETDAIARFTYTVDDGNGHQVVGDVTVTVLPEPLPEPPYAQDDSTFTFVDEPVTIDVLRNDGDPSGERPTLVGRPGCPSGGRAVITADGQVRYVPPLGQSGAFRCTYEVTNSVGLRATASIIVSVREPLVTNEPPNTVLDTMFVEVGATDRIDVTDNDEDPDGDDDELEVVSSTAPSLGTATRDGNVITFTAGSETGVTTISYQVADAEGAVSSGQVSIRITDPTNDPPIAQDDRATVVSPFGTTINVLKNDSDPNEPASGLTVDSVTRLSGRATLSLDGSVVSVVPDPDYIGDVIATYTVRDSGGLTDTARITVVVLEPENRPPQAVDDVNDVNNGGSVATPVLFNDSDPDGDDLSLSIVAGPDPALGSANLSGNSIVFTAQPGAAGTAVITYSISDGEFTSEAVVRITVRPCSESTPVAQDGFLFTGYQQPIAVNLAAFTANGTITVLKAPPGYSAGVYTPPAGENGNVAIDYAVENSCRQRATGQIVIDVNRGPVAQPVTIPMGRGETREFPVSSLAGDDEALSITGSPGAPGWVVTEPGRVVLAPQLAEATGTYSWSTNVVDPGGLTASVAFTVTIVNAAPFANGDTADVSGGPASFDLLANDVDPDGDDARLRLQSIPTTVTFENGGVGTVTVVGAEQRVVAIDPLTGLGQATFTYTIVDPDGAVSGPATVVVTAGPVNSAPTAADQTVAVPTGAPTDVVLAASDPDGDPLTVIELVDPAGIVTGVNGITVSIIVEADGTFTFTYRVSDGVATSAVVTVTVTATTTTTTTLPPPTTVPPTTVPPTTAPPTTVPPTTAPPTTAPPTTVPPTITTSPPPPDQDQ